MANAYPLVEFSDITVLKEIGRGGFGIVYKANWQGSVIAVKDFFSNDEKDGKKVEKELTQLFRIRHPNIIDIYGASVRNGHTYLLMEYAYGGNLRRVVFGSAEEVYTTERAISWMYQCAKAVAFLHGMQPKPLLHRDLKPSKLLLTDKNCETLKICDIGNVRELKTTMTEIVGTFSYMAPEVFHNGEYTEKCDVFSFAIILWEVFIREEYSKTFNSHWAIPIVVSQGHRPQLKDVIPDGIQTLMTSCWKEEPSKRPCMKDVVIKMEGLLKTYNSNDAAEGNEIILSNSTSQDYPYEIKTIPAQNESSSNIKLEEQVGKGAFGIVYKAHWQGKVVAVKDFFLNDEKDREKVEKELTRSRRITKHPNIIDVYGVTLKKGHTYLLMEYAYGGSLERVLFGSANEQYTRERAISWMYQCAKGVAFLHETKPKPLLHRDLKPANLLLTDRNFETLKICDFGTVSELKTTMTENTGSLAWTAPEVFDNGKYTEKCDIFIFGIILWEVFTRVEYSKTFNSKWAIYKKVTEGHRPELKDEWPDELKFLMTSCWQENPFERPSMKHVVLEMEILLTHQWFTGQGIPIEKHEQDPKDNFTGISDRDFFEEINEEVGLAVEIDRAEGNEIIPSSTTSQDNLFKIIIPGMPMSSRIGDIKEVLVLEQLSSLSSIKEEAFGKGWFGITYKAQVEVDDERKMLALKVYNRKYSNMDYKLCKFYSYIPHHILAASLLGVYFTLRHERKIYYGLEYAEGGSLYKILHSESKRYSEGDALELLTKLALGLKYFHEEDIFVNMLTSRNVFIDRFRNLKVKIGLPVEEQEADFSKTTYKSAAWMAPEVHEDGKYSKSSDIYSLEIIIWEVLNRRIPFEGWTPDEIADMVKRGTRPPLEEVDDASIRKLLRSCWQRDPQRRPTLSSVYLTLWKFVQIPLSIFSIIYYLTMQGTILGW